MSIQHTVLPEIASLVQSLRQQVADSRRPQSAKGRNKLSASVNSHENVLHDKVLSLLDLIEQLEQPESLPTGSAAFATEPQYGQSIGPILDQLLTTLDGGLAHWQSKITLAYSQSATQELADHLKQAKCLHESLEVREERLESQRQQLEQSLAKLLQREARSSRQRTAIAQALRAQKAEMLLELEILRQEQIGQIRQELELEISSTQSANQAELESLRNELADSRQQLLELEGSQALQADENDKLLKELEDELGTTQRELEQANQQLRELEGSQSSQADEQVKLLKELEDKLAIAHYQLEQANQRLRELEGSRSSQADEQGKLLKELEDELAIAHNQLEQANQRLRELEGGQSNQADEQGKLLKELEDELDIAKGELEQAHDRLQELEASNSSQADEHGSLLRELEQQLAQANNELETLRQQHHGNPETPLLLQDQADTIAALKSQMLTLEGQLEELHDQNSDLAAQIAKQQVLSSGSSPHMSFQQESLSWEERKKLIMQQLEDESDTGFSAPSDEQVERHLEIEQLLLTTQSEIEKRDREIAELTAIVEQQSDTRQGVAIGAAAFAQAFDNDEIIQQERAKLKEIQREWEEKLRQAEVDVSLERAKLARERLQLEQELQNTQREKSVDVQSPDKAKKRKWLEHLGLRDENRGDK